MIDLTALPTHPTQLSSVKQETKAWAWSLQLWLSSPQGLPGHSTRLKIVELEPEKRWFHCLPTASSGLIWVVADGASPLTRHLVNSRIRSRLVPPIGLQHRGAPPGASHSRWWWWGSESGRASLPCICTHRHTAGDTVTENCHPLRHSQSTCRPPGSLAWEGKARAKPLFTLGWPLLLWSGENASHLDQPGTKICIIYWSLLGLRELS